MEEEKKMEVDDPEVISLNDDSTNSSTNDTSQVVEPTTPKADKSLNKSSLDRLNESASLSASKLTKSHEKMDKNLKLQIRLENEKKRLEEKEKKEREKKEREEKRLKREEELKKKRQEEEELKKKRQQEREKQAQEKAEREKKLAEEKAEREKKRLEQLNAKNEEKKKKEEERKQKEEERKQKEEEKKKQEEEKKKQEEEKQKEEDEKRRKEEKIKSHFVNYFIKKDPPTSSSGEKSSTRFMPFQPKPNMYIAPLCRRQDVLAMTEEEHEEYIRTLDEALFNIENKQKNGKLYLDEIKENKHLIRKQVKSYRKDTLPVEKCASDENSNDVLEVKLCDVASIQTKFKVKFLLFDPKQYRRPPYYGTWRKKSKAVNGRRPFGKDEKHFNYEIDSDEEWEDEPADAESIADSDKGDEEDEMVDDEDDDGFFVPHGHLSDDELDEEDRLLDADTKKAREDAKNQIWETERKKGYKVLIPKSYFVPICINSSEKVVTNLKLKNDEIKFLEQYQIVPIATSLPITINNEVTNKAAAAAAGVSDEMVPKSASKPPKASKPKQLANANQSLANSQTPGSPQVLSTSVTNSPNSTPSIIKFISKVSKKNIICNLEQINPPSAVTTTTTTTTATSVTSTATNADTPNKLNLLNSPSQVSKIPMHAQNTPSSCQMNLSAVTPSPRVNPTNSNTAEKRSCSVSSSDSCVKRLKLDDTTQERPNDSATTNSPIGAKRPHNEHKTTNTNSPNIMSLFKKNDLKKAVALNAIEKHENSAANVDATVNPDKDASKNSDDQNKENSKASLIVID